MREVYLTKEKQKAEDLLKKDDIVSRASITIRSTGSFDAKEEGVFIILEGSEEQMKRAEELLKGIAEKYDKKDEILEKFDSEQDAAVQGFGNILGG